MTTTTREQTVPPEPAAGHRGGSLLAYILLGAFFGVVLIKGEIASWYRIQEMFRFQGFHMYGTIGSAWAVAALSIQWIRRSGVTAWTGEPIEIRPKYWGSSTRYWLGGTIFGMGWALTGACPGPIISLIGAGMTAMVVTLASAVAGAWLYGLLRPSLPH